MKQELSDKLKTDFPGLYGELGCGFECLDGWFDILYKLSGALIKAAEEHHITIGLDDENSGLYARQVKEKFGTLCYYTSYSWEETDDLIHEAESQSAHVCEKCGRTGTLVCENHWYMVRCLKCLQEIRATPQNN